MASKTIYAILGLGTTGRLFQHIKVEGAEIVVLDWPKPEAHDSLKDYAKKFLKQIDTSKPFYLLGVSFGGMLSIELSKLVSPQKTSWSRAAKHAASCRGSSGFVSTSHYTGLSPSGIIAGWHAIRAGFLASTKATCPIFRDDRRDAR